LVLKREFKKYLNPRELTDIKDEEITSHSSMLFNKRVDINLTLCDEMSRVSKSNPFDPISTHDWFSCVDTVYNNVCHIFSDSEKKILKEIREMYWKLYMKIRDKKNQTKQNFFNLHMLVDKFYFNITSFLQKREYFMRMEKKEIKGIGSALKKLGEEK